MSDKRPLLLFSGGLDSTFLLQETLLETDVDILYVDCGQHGQKIQAEQLARPAILRQLHDRGHLVDDENRHHIRRMFDCKATSYAEAPGMASAQAPVWLMAALYYFDPSVHSEVRVAYVMGDDALIFRHEMEAAWTNLCLVAKGVAVPLVFPLMLWRKATILKRILPYLLELIWVCELPVWKGLTITPCHRCVACKRHDREMREAFGSTKAFRQSVARSKKSLKDALDAKAAERVDKVDPSGEIEDPKESGSDSSRVSQAPAIKPGRTKPPRRVKPERSNTTSAKPNRSGSVSG